MAPWNRRHRPNALTAAALPMNTEGRREDQPRYDTWQDEGWAMYDAVGEFRQGITWLANVLSRARLVPAYAPERPGDEPEIIDPETNDPTVDLVAGIAHGIGGQSDLLRSATVHLSVPGVGWFVAGIADNPAASWKFYSADEIRKRPTSGMNGARDYVIQVRTEDSKWIDLPDETVPVKVWRPHDRYHWKADSSTRAALPILRRLELLNRRVDAQTQSRLAMNGVYWVASEIVFPENPNLPNGVDPFMHDLMQAGITAIKTPGSAAAAMPLINRAPFQFIKDGIRHDRFYGEDDADLLEKRRFEINRLATAIDVPPEVLMGIAGINHWGAWAMEESSLKTTVTSLLELICWSLTQGYLAPALQAVRAQENPLEAETGVPREGQEPTDGRRRIIWYDLSELTVRPDRSQTAVTFHEDLTITDEATMRETGFDVTDLLEVTTPEFRKRLGVKLAQTPATAAVGLELLGITTTAAVNLGPGQEEVEAPATPNGDTPTGPPGTRDAEPSPLPEAAPRPSRNGA